MSTMDVPLQWQSLQEDLRAEGEVEPP